MLAKTKKRISLVGVAVFLLAILAVNIIVALVSMGLRAEAFADPAFQKVWNRSDAPQVVTGRSYLWGPEPNVTKTEDYREAPGGKRLVQYFDKSRMELTNPSGDKNSPYYVTNGLLVNELMSGKLQVGDNDFVNRLPSLIGVAGDPDDFSAPSYYSLGQVRGDPPAPLNTTIITTLDKDGIASTDNSYAKYDVKPVTFIQDTNHTIAAPFWTFLNQQGRVLNAQGNVVTEALFSPTFYATGFPVTEAYWAKVRVAGQVKDVLMQGFERRVLTYTPSNSAAFQVEMGNVGQHYYRWRYPEPGVSPSIIPSTISPSTIGGAGALVSLCNGQNAPSVTTLSVNASLGDGAISSGSQNLCIAVNKSNQAVEGAQVAITVTHKGVSQSYTASPTNKAGKTVFSWDLEAIEKGTPITVSLTVTYLGEKASTTLSWTPQ